jgi:putative spermidine/putrescine transport system substrate-binding protein
VKLNFTHVKGDVMSKKKYFSNARRIVSAFAGVTLLALGIASCSSSSGNSDSANGNGSDLSGRDMVYASYGGTTEEYTEEAWGNPFEKASGAEVIYDSPIDLGKLRAMVQSKNVEWDLLQGSYMDAFAPGYEKLFEKTDLGDFDTSSLIDGTVTDHGIGAYVLSYLIAYRTDTGRKENPKTWEDFYDVEKFPGKRGIENADGPLVLESALLADGVKPEDLYPLDLDRAFAKLDTIKDHIVWYDTGAQQQELLQNKTVDYLMAWNGRAYDLVAKGVPVDMSFDHQIAYMGYHLIPKGSENSDVANAFIKESLKPENQAAFAEKTAYAPVNSEALDMIKPEVAKYIPTAEENADSIVRLDEKYWTEHLDEVAERWSSWVLE